QGLLSKADSELGSGWSTTAERDHGAEMLAQGLFRSDRERLRLTIEQLRTKFNQGPKFHEEERFDDLPRLLLEGYVDAGVLLYGANVRCTFCGTAEWHPVDAISREMRCNGCLNLFALPLEPEWSYRLN